jgi:hypothetical protein
MLAGIITCLVEPLETGVGVRTTQCAPSATLVRDISRSAEALGAGAAVATGASATGAQKWV